jgi:hypothetical protein
MSRTPNTPNTTNQFYTETQLAERWAMSVKTLQAWRERGNGLVFIKLGKAVRYRLTDIEDFEAKNLKTNTSMT